MMHAVKTTHAVPERLPALQLVKKSNTLTCGYCAQPVGSYSTQAERTLLEVRHICKEKLQAATPLVAVPFN
jgi:hypothetical protein